MKDKKAFIVVGIALAVIVVSLILLQSSRSVASTSEGFYESQFSDHLGLTVEEAYCKEMHPTDYDSCLQRIMNKQQPINVPMYTFVETPDIYGSPDRPGLASYFPHEPSNPFLFPVNKVDHANIVQECLAMVPNDQMEQCVYQKIAGLQDQQKLLEVTVEPYNGLVINMMPKGLAEEIEGQVAYDNKFTHAQQVNPWTAPIHLD